MPQMANVTVKKNDGTTDVIYTALIPSAGDTSPAIWRNNTVGAAPGQRPEVKCVSRDNGPKTARRVTYNASYPSLVTGSDGRVSVADKLVFDLSVVVPQGMLQTDIDEGVSQFCNFAQATLTKDTIKSGFAPT